jgi:Family of unknown function (DUF5335)
MSKAQLRKRAAIEVSSLNLGGQILADWVPMLDIAYDAKDHALDVVLDAPVTYERYSWKRRPRA